MSDPGKTPQFVITEIQPREGYLHLVFADGAAGQVNVRRAVGAFKVMRGLLVPEVFVKARLIDLGRTVAWPGHDAWELAADNLRAWMTEQATGFSHAKLIEWMHDHKMSLDQAAAELGLSRRMLAYYRSGAKPIPRLVALACWGWVYEQKRDRPGRLKLLNSNW